MPKILDGSERILCVPSADLTPLGISGTGFFKLRAEMGATLDLVLAGARFLPRTDALESDPSWRQLIPYVIGHRHGKVLTYRRGSAGSETRLHARLTFGAGGHWNHMDSLELPRAWSLGLRNCARREILEEFGVQPPHGLEAVGLLIDDRDAVGTVHLGVVVPWQIPSAQVDQLRFGNGIESAGWMDPREVRRHEGWEGWSELLIPHLGSLIGEPAPETSSGLAVAGSPLGGRPGVRNGTPASTPPPPWMGSYREGRAR